MSEEKKNELNINDLLLKNRQLFLFGDITEMSSN